MRTLQEHIDALDRMVDIGTSVPQMRSQISFIGREVAALEADYARLAEVHTKLQELHQALDAKLAAQDKATHDAGWDAIRKQSDSYHRMIQSKQLKGN